MLHSPPSPPALGGTPALALGLFAVALAACGPKPAPTMACAEQHLEQACTDLEEACLAWRGDEPYRACQYAGDFFAAKGDRMCAARLYREGCVRQGATCRPLTALAKGLVFSGTPEEKKVGAGWLGLACAHERKERVLGEACRTLETSGD